MKILIEIASIFIRLSGIYTILNNWIINRKVTIVLYHNPKPSVFEKHMAFVNRHYSFISLDSLVDALITKDWTTIPDNSIVITFDDGHSENYNLIDVFKKFNIKPTIYCCSEIICTNRHFWWKEISSDKIEILKRLTNKKRISELKEKYNFTNIKEYNSKQSLSFTQIQELNKHAIIGSHTLFHPILTCCDEEEIQNEIINSKLQIENITNGKCNHFCFPNGDYDKRVIEIVKNAGYKSARTIDVGWNDINTDPYKLKITGISDNASLNQVIAQLTGITMYLRYLSKGKLRGLHKTIFPRKNETTF